MTFFANGGPPHFAAQLHVQPVPGEEAHFTRNHQGRAVDDPHETDAQLGREAAARLGGARGHAPKIIDRVALVLPNILLGMMNQIHSPASPLDSRQLLAFQILATTGSFTETAKRLNLSQSAISHSVKALEENVNCRLVDRVGKRALLNQAGEQFTTLNHTLSGASFARFDYGYDSVNRRTYEQRNQASGDVYGYDAIDQVASINYDATNPTSGTTGTDRTVGYTYDAVGNRSAVTDSVNGNTSYTANSDNQYTNVAGSAYGYDGNGNLNAGASGAVYIYDAQNRLTTAATSLVGGNVDHMSYDSRNRVVERTINGTATYLIYDGWDLIEERSSINAVLATYVHGARADEMLSRTTPSGTVYYHHNALGSVTDLTSASGVVVEKYKYDAFGKPAITDGSGNPLTASAYGNRILFTGREYLAEVNLYDYRNRVYSAALGRFLQTDPLRFSAGDVNIYRYCGNNPLNKADAMGLCDEDASSLLSLSLAASLAALDNSLNGLWSAVGNAIPGSGLSNAANLSASADESIGLSNEWAEMGLGEDTAFSGLSGASDFYAAQAAYLQESAAVQTSLSFTESGAVSGYGAFGLTGAEGISATATTGLVGLTAAAGLAAGYGIDQIPVGGGQTIGDQIYNLAPGAYNAIGGAIYNTF
jgi:RHS repeat-associated protein